MKESVKIKLIYFDLDNLRPTAPTRKPGFGTLLTINIIFEVQFFVGGSVVKIPACV